MFIHQNPADSKMDVNKTKIGRDLNNLIELAQNPYKKALEEIYELSFSTEEIHIALKQKDIAKKALASPNQDDKP